MSLPSTPRARGGRIHQPRISIRGVHGDGVRHSSNLATTVTLPAHQPGAGDIELNGIGCNPSRAIGSHAVTSTRFSTVRPRNTRPQDSPRNSERLQTRSRRGRSSGNGPGAALDPSEASRKHPILRPQALERVRESAEAGGGGSGDRRSDFGRVDSVEDAASPFHRQKARCSSIDSERSADSPSRSK